MRIRCTAAALFAVASLWTTVAQASPVNAFGRLRPQAIPRAVPPDQAPTPNFYVATRPDSGELSMVSADFLNGNTLWGLSYLSSFGMAVDASGTLYVGTDTYPQGIYVFPGTQQSGAPGAPVRYLDDRGFDPAGIVVEKNGTVIVANSCVDPIGGGGPCAYPGNVIAYRKGSTRPSVTYVNPGFFPTFVTADHEGNVYADQPGVSPVYRWTSPTQVAALPLTSSKPAGLATDAMDDLVVADAYPATSSSVEIFARGSWKLLRTFPSGSGPAGVLVISLDQSNTYLYAATYEACTTNDQPAVHVYNFATGATAACDNMNGVVSISAVTANPEAVP